MPHSDFKTIDDIKTKFSLKIIFGDSLLPETEEISEILTNNILLALNINTEKARSRPISELPNKLCFDKIEQSIHTVP